MAEKCIDIVPFSREEEIRSFEVNAEKNLNIAGIARKFQEIAWEHASRLKYGFSHLAERNFHWVLSRTEIRIHKAPAWTEFIRLKTWPSGLDSLFFIRDFEFLNQQGEVCVSGSSGWMIVNEKLRPQIPHHTMDEIPVFDKKAIGANPGKLRFRGEMEPVFSVKIRLSDLDPNYHTNNVRYYQWMCDCLSEKGISDNDITRVEMNFLHECLKGDVLHILYGKDESSHWVKGRLKTDEDIFLCRVEV